MTACGMSEGIEALRRAGLTPTRQRVTIAGLAFSGPTVALTAREVQDRAADADLALDAAEVSAALDELRGAGVLPILYEPTPAADLDLLRAARLLQAMGNAHRLTVLRQLTRGEHCAGELGRATGLQPSALSQHLARLLADGLVQRRRSTSRIYYALAGETAAAVMRSLAA